jgi:hypothetical protein
MAPPSQVERCPPNRVNSKVQVDPGVGGQPGLDDRVLVGAVVVADQVDLQVLGDLGVDLGEELLELARAMSSVQAGDHGAVGCVERRKESRGAVTDVVMGAALGHARHQR